MGTGFPISYSTKWKLSTGSEHNQNIVVVDNFMLSILGTRKFLDTQGYYVTESIIFQDNKSAILMQKNGKSSSGKIAKHINIQYFFVTNRTKKVEVRVDG